MADLCTSTDPTNPAILKNSDYLLDPWKKPYQYDSSGTKNNGTQPDIWTVDPKTGVTIGNWSSQQR